MPYAEAIPRGLEAACRDWNDLLGTDNVPRSAGALLRYGSTTLPTALTPMAVILAQRTEHVAGALRVVSARRIPLYPAAGPEASLVGNVVERGSARR